MHTNPEVLALVALGERESATAEDLDHIAQCEICERDVTELGHLSQLGRSVSDHFTLETPSPQVWERIRAQLGVSDSFSSPLVPPAASPRTPSTAAAVATGHLTPADSSSKDITEDTSSAPPIRVRIDRPRRKRRVVGFVLALVLGLLAGVGGTLAWQQLRPLSDTMVASAPLDALPDWTGTTGQARLEVDAAGRYVLVVSMVTPRPVDGIQQVWLINRAESSMVTLGNLTAPIERFTLPKALDIREFPVVDISVEKPDGNLLHSGTSIVRGTLQV